jgi:ABC-type multidrug transport system ATPase subunit
MIGGHDVVREPIAARTLVAYVPQTPAFGGARVGDALAFVARLRRLDTGRIPEVLRVVGLEEHAGAPVRRLSGGMQQRLSLAAALLVDAPVLLFDEPTASLDRDAQATFIRLVERLRADGRTLLLASHRPEEVERLTGRVIHLDRGRIVAPPAPSRGASAGNVIHLAARSAS